MAVELLKDNNNLLLAEGVVALKTSHQCISYIHDKNSWYKSEQQIPEAGVNANCEVIHFAKPDCNQAKSYIR